MHKYPNKKKKECEKLLYEHLENKKKANPNHIEYYYNKFPELSDDECQLKLKEYRKSVNGFNIEYWKKKYPGKTEHEYEELVKQRREKCKNNRDVSGKNNPRHRSNVSDIEIRESSPLCIEFYMKRYPNETKEEWNNMLQDKKNEMAVKAKMPENLNTRIEYYIKNGMSTEEAKEAISKRQSTFTIKKCIEKYGEEAGVKIFKERQKKRVIKIRKYFELNSGSRSLQSGIANRLFNDICNLLNLNADKYKEKFIYERETNTGYSYDFCYNNKIIEFQGDYWHCNPKIYKEDYFNKVIKMSAKEIWNKDAAKKRIAEKNNYSVLYVWESDYKADPTKELIKCIKFLKNE